MSDSQKISEIKKLRNDLTEANRQIKTLDARLLNDYEERGVQLDISTHNVFLASIMEENHQRIINEYPNDTFQHLFWKTQWEAIRKPKTSMRWHPSIIKWCIYLRHKSSGAYEMLRSSNCVSLPSQRTLRDYMHYYKTKSGRFRPSID